MIDLNKSYILIVDDDPATCQTLQDIFTEKGYDVAIASSGQEALKKAEKLEIDVVLIDIKLPDMSGTTLLKDFKHKSPEIISVIITGYASLENAVSTLKDGADGYFIKPLIIDEVLLKVEDALKRQRLQRELSESEKRYRSLIGNIADVIVETANDGTITYVSPQMFDMFGYQREEVIGRNAVECLHLEDITTFTEIIVQAGKSTEIISTELRARHKDGHYIPISSRGSQIHSADQIKFISVLRDNSDQKKSEEALRKSRDELEQRVEERTAELVKAQKIAHLGNYSWNLQTGEVSWSEELKEILGYILEKPSRELIESSIHPEDRDWVLDAMRFVQENGNLLNVEYRIIRPDGTLCHIHEQTEIERDETDQIKRIFGTLLDISLRKKTEESLRESEEKFRMLSEQSVMGICIVQDNQIKYANEAMANIMEYSITEMLEWKKDDLFKLISFTAKSFAEKETQKLKLGEIEALQLDNYQVLAKSGRSRWVDVYAKPIQFKGKNANLVTFVEVSERKLAEEKLQTSEARFRSLVENAPYLIMIVDLIGRIQFINRPVPGIDVRDSIGKSIFSYIQPEFHDMVRNTLRKVFETGNPGSYEMQGAGPFGSISWYETQVGSIKRDERVVAATLITSDVTERKWAERQVLQSEERYRGLYESNRDGIAFYDIQGNILDANRAFRNMYGYSLGELRTLTIQKLTPQKNHELETEIIQSQVFSRGYSDEYEKEGIKKDGSIFPLIARVWLIKDDSGKPKGLWGIVRDISERKRAEVALRNAYNDLEQRVKDRTAECSAVNKELEMEIAERNRIEKQLRSSEEKFRSIFENAPLGIVHLDQNGIITTCNVKFSEIMGSSIEKISGFNTISSLKNENLIHAIKESLSGRLGRFEGEYLSMTGGKKSVSNAYFAPIFSEDGSVLNSIGIVEDISERVQIEDALRQSEANFQDLFNSAPVAYLYAGIDGLVKNVNEAAIELFGYELEVFHGTRVIDLYADESKSKARKIFENFRQGIRVETEEMVYKTKNGREFQGLLSVSPVKDESGQIVRSRSIIINITARKQAEEKFATIIQGSLDGFWVVDSEGRILDVNRAYCQMIGYTREELLTMSISDVEEVENPDEIAQHIKKIQEQGYDRFETSHRHKGGKIIDIEVSANFSNTAGGEFVVFMRDITDRKRVEEALRESERKYRELANSITDIFFAMDKNLEYTYWNMASEKFTGISAKDAIGKSIHEIFPDTEETRRAMKVYQEVLKTQQAQSVVNEYHLEGKKYFFEISAYPSKEGLSVFVKDITERKQFELKLKESEERFKALYKGIPVPAYTWQRVDSDFILIDYNFAAEKVVRGSMKEYLGIKASEMYNDRPDILEDLDHCFNEKETISREINYHFKTTQEERILFTNYGYVPPDLILVHTEDITEKKETERKLKESEEKYLLIAEKANDMIAVINDKLEYEFINEGVAKVLGFSREEFLGKPRLDLVHPDDIEAASKSARDMFETGEGFIKTRVKCKDGHYTQLEIKGSTFLDKDGNRKAVIIGRDVTERKTVKL